MRDISKEKLSGKIGEIGSFEPLIWHFLCIFVQCNIIKSTFCSESTNLLRSSFPTPTIKSCNVCPLTPNLALCSSTHISCLALLLAPLILSPYMYSTNGIGMKRMDKKPSSDEAQSIPSFLYMAVANNGKPAPKLERMKSLPAKTEAAYAGYASPR